MWMRSLVLLCLPAVAVAQPEPSWTTFGVEAYAGGVAYGRFLEQNFDGGQRELTPDASFSAGGAFNVHPLDQTWIRLGYTWAGSDLEYHDDTGTGVERLEQDDLPFLASHAITLEGLALFLDDDSRINPYAVAGIGATIWHLGDDDGRRSEIVAGDDEETLLRFGATAGVGVQVRAIPQLVVRGEWNNLGMGNPFDGETSFLATRGDTFSEPPIVRMSRFTLGLVWVFDA